MTRVLVSVTSVAEARLARDAGVAYIDLKDPAAGALGALAPEVQHAIVEALRADGAAPPVSATVGDHLPTELQAIERAVRGTAAAGVDLVKVGVARHPDAPALLQHLATLSHSLGRPIVPVLLADDGLDDTIVRAALEAGRDRFPVLMLDTAGKRSGSLLERVPRAALQRFVAQVREAGAACGLAGALQPADLPALRSLAPDLVGFRTAACRDGRRDAPLDAARVAALMRGFAAPLARQ